MFKTYLSRSKDVNDSLDPAGESAEDQLEKTKPATITLEEVIFILASSIHYNYLIWDTFRNYGEGDFIKKNLA